ncbi:SPRY domain-containing SOCS box protein 3a [Denticeps clupeoides]|uniref:SPRY domain-containing SOCS box protein 3 n=1 Tax=Denticeps clupeoides TaxID=299321 RepID=A0AAY4B736_9TELE|nr:SPRY domain-containing SOCS box protein 3-like [Denticeps clupeoides]XP_028842660.1 SPRY domain-containing SOCS box protein 3-like [Denticeps clupeoides]XP_028842661.1 SPRY domain-containing SOCS box protein 3-like [Denticeps clupeoides]XP_028842662.1 SPRY domain-containing SOCS box protein 3-like [Denticeps clupeoides]
MSRRSRNTRAWRTVWSGLRRDADARATDSDEWAYERLQYSDSDSEAEFSVVVPPVPSAIPVTGESYCSCDSQSESSCNPHLRGFTRVRDCHCGEDYQDFDWVWDDCCRSTATLLSCENRKVSFHSEYSCGTAAIRGSKELTEGQHFWEIKMTSPVYGTDMMVGIGTSDVNLDKYRHTFCSLLGKDDESWGLSYTGLLHHKGDKVSFSSRFGQGSIIGVHLDTWHGTLTFFKNRKCIGVAVTELQNKSVFPMACSTAAKSSMKLIRSVSTPTSLQYLCCSRLRKLLPSGTDALRVLPLPPGLRHLLHSKLGWVLSLDHTQVLSPPPSQTHPPAGLCSGSDSEGCASDPEASQRKRCRWT